VSASRKVTLKFTRPPCGPPLRASGAAIPAMCPGSNPVS
jgi:hypothetical protein